MGQINDKLNRVVNINNVKMDNANTAAKAILSISNNLRITNNDAAKIAQKDAIEANKKIYGDALAKLKQMEDTKDGIQAIKNVEDAVVPAKDANEKFMELYIANKTAEAGAVLMNESIPLTQKISDQFDKLIKYEQQRNLTRYEEAKQAYGNAELLMVIFGVAALIIGITISIVTSRLITVPLRDIIGKVEELAGGNLRVSIDSGRGDEIGSLSRSMGRMVQSFNQMINHILVSANSVAFNSGCAEDRCGQIGGRRKGTVGPGGPDRDGSRGDESDYLRYCPERVGIIRHLC